MITKIDAILSLRPGSEFVIHNGVLQWHDTNQTQPTEEEIQAELTRLQAEYDANQYQRDRVYPSIQDQLDMQYWDKVNGTTTWQDAIAKVKADTPKPGE